MTTTKQKNLRRMKKREKVGNGSSLVSFQKFLTQNKNLTPEFEPGITQLTREEVARHSSPSDMWTIYRGNVYNITPFLDYHPGGEEDLLKAAGTDCTELYDKHHPWVNADAVLGHLKLGPLRGLSPSRSKTPALNEINGDISTRLRAPYESPLKSHSADLEVPRVGLEQSSTVRTVLEAKKLTIQTSENPTPAPYGIRARQIVNRPVGIFRLFLSKSIV
jgi:cytochrome b involved in lipid metabolism